MTFMLFKNNRPVGNKKFATYELCRQWARKLARKALLKPAMDVSDKLWRTPSIGMYGYEIRRI